MTAITSIDNLAVLSLLTALKEVAKSEVKDTAEEIIDARDETGAPIRVYTNEQIATLKALKCGDLDFSVPEDDRFDIISRTDPDIKLSVSDRAPTNGECRSDRLRELLTAYGESNPDASVYDALAVLVKDYKTSSLYFYVKQGLVNYPDFDVVDTDIDMLASVLFPIFSEGEGLDPESEDVQNRILMILPEVQLLITLKEKLSDEDIVNFKNLIRNNVAAPNDENINQLKNFVMALPDVQKRNREISPLLNTLKSVDRKITYHRNNGNAEALAAAEAFKSEIEDAIGIYVIDGNKDTFEGSISDAIEEAKASSLSEHRGWSQIFSSIGGVVASFCSLGIANVVSKAVTGQWSFWQTKTDSIEKVEAVEEAAQKIIRPE